MLRDLPWSKSEKTLAREAFGKAYNKELGIIIAEVKRRIAKLSDPKEHLEDSRLSERSAPGNR